MNKNCARWRSLFNKGKLNRNTHTWPKSTISRCHLLQAGPSEISHFFHLPFTVNGLPMNFKHFNLYNTNVGKMIPKHMTFKLMKHLSQIIFLQRIFEPLMQTVRNQCMDLMQGGMNIFTILHSEHNNPNILFLIKQIHIPHSIEL